MTELARNSHVVPLADEVRKEALGKHERRSHIRGLLWLALAAIAFTILRAGLHNVFASGWWQLW